MKILFIGILFISLVSNEQIININNGVNTTTLDFTYPLYFEQEFCRFQVNGGSGGFIEFQNFHHLNCETKTYHLVVDNHMYDLPDGFTLYYSSFNYVMFDFFNTGKCYSLSGAELSAGSSFYVQFFNLRFDVNGKTDLLYFADNSAPYFMIDLNVGDIFCETGVSTNGFGQFIFNNGFE